MSVVSYVRVSLELLVPAAVAAAVSILMTQINRKVHEVDEVFGRLHLPTYHNVNNTIRLSTDLSTDHTIKNSIACIAIHSAAILV